MCSAAKKILKKKKKKKGATSPKTKYNTFLLYDKKAVFALNSSFSFQYIQVRTSLHITQIYNWSEPSHSNKKLLGGRIRIQK